MPQHPEACRGGGVSAGVPVGGAPGLEGVGWRSRQGRDGEIYIYIYILEGGGRITTQADHLHAQSPVHLEIYICVDPSAGPFGHAPWGVSPRARGDIGDTTGGRCPGACPEAQSRDFIDFQTTKSPKSHPGFQLGHPFSMVFWPCTDHPHTKNVPPSNFWHR